VILVVIRFRVDESDRCSQWDADRSVVEAHPRTGGPRDNLTTVPRLAKVASIVSTSLCRSSGCCQGQSKTLTVRLLISSRTQDTLSFSSVSRSRFFGSTSIESW